MVYETLVKNLTIYPYGLPCGNKYRAIFVLFHRQLMKHCSVLKVKY